MNPLILSLFGPLLVAMTAYPLWRGLRTASVHVRGRGRIERRKHPLEYWSSITFTAIMCGGGVAMTVWGLTGVAGWR